MKNLLLTILVLSIILPTISKSIDIEPLGAYKLNNKWHIFDYSGKLLFPPVELEQIGGYAEGMILVIRKVDGKKVWSFMDLNGKIAFDMDVDGAKVFNDGMAMVHKCMDKNCQIQKYGYYNKKGELAIPFEYLDVTIFVDDYAWVMNKEKRGYIDKTGKFLFKAEDGTFGLPFVEGLAVMHNKDAKFGFIDTTGKSVIEFKFEEATSFSEGLAAVYNSGKFEYINHNGEVIIPTNRPFAKSFKNNYAFTAAPDEKYNPLWQVINKQGIIMTADTYVNAHNFSEGISAVQQHNLKWIFIDPFGQKIIENEFDYADEFHKGLAWASLRDKEIFGYIDQMGVWEIKLPKADAYVDFRVNRIVR